jgi:hypothetical protein
VLRTPFSSPRLLAFDSKKPSREAACVASAPQVTPTN